MSTVLPPNLPAAANTAATAGKAGHAGTPHAKGGGDSAAQAWQREMERAQMTQWLKPAVATPRAATPAAAPARQAPAQAGMPSQAAAAVGGPRGPAEAPTGQDSAQAAGAPAAGAPTRSAGTGAQQTQAALPAQIELVHANPQDASPVPAEGPRAGQQIEAEASAANASPGLSTAAQQNAGGPEQPPPQSLAVQKAEAARSAWLQPGMASADAAGTEPPGPAADPLTDAPADTPQEAGARPAAASHQPGRVEALLRDLPSVQGMRCHAQWSSDGRVDVWLGMDGPRPEQAAQLAWAVSELRQSLSRQGHLLGTVVCNGRTVFEGATDAGADGLAPAGAVAPGLARSTPATPSHRADRN